MTSKTPPADRFAAGPAEASEPADAPGPADAPSPAQDRAGLFRRLETLGIETRTIEHDAVHTVDESSRTHRDLPGAHTKNLFVKDKKGRVFLVVVPALARVDLKALHRAIGAQGRLSFGRPYQLHALLGVRPGSVTVFGAINDPDGAVTVVLDREIAEADTVCGHPLENTATTAIGRDDLLRFLRDTGHEPVVVDVPRETEAGGTEGA